MGGLVGWFGNWSLISEKLLSVGVTVTEIVGDLNVSLFGG